MVLSCVVSVCRVHSIGKMIKDILKIYLAILGQLELYWHAFYKAQVYSNDTLGRSGKCFEDRGKYRVISKSQCFIISVGFILKPLGP